MTEIILRALVERKIDRALAAGEECPFPPSSHAADLFHERKQAAQPAHIAAPARRRFDPAQVA